MNGLALAPATCFGKLPTRGDFVKGPGQHQLIAMLDGWLSDCMASLSEDPHWKAAYDQGPGVDFLFVGPRSRVSVIGHLRPSQDVSGRRFPFLGAATIERDDLLMLRCAPACLDSPFKVLRESVRTGTEGGELGDILAGLEQLDSGADFEEALQADPLGRFARRTTLAGLSALLAPAVSAGAPRRIILAIGLLLRPLLGNPGMAIARELVLPLPGEVGERHLVAGLWLYLVTAFLRGTACEVQVLLAPWRSTARMVIGFNGATPGPLLTLLTPDPDPARFIELSDPEWIETHPDLTRDYGVAKLSSYLGQPALPLEAALNTFREVFLGE